MGEEPRFQRNQHPLIATWLQSVEPSLGHRQNVRGDDEHPRAEQDCPALMGVRQQGSVKFNSKGSPRSRPGPRRPHTWLDDRHGMRRDVRPCRFCPSRFLKETRRSSACRSQLPCPNLGHRKRRLTGRRLANNWTPRGWEYGTVLWEDGAWYDPPPPLAPLPILTVHNRLLPCIPITSCSCFLSLAPMTPNGENTRFIIINLSVLAPFSTALPSLSHTRATRDGPCCWTWAARILRRWCSV
jgi:hypothetical protein